MDECKNTDEIRDGGQLARPGDAAGQPWDLEREREDKHPRHQT